MLYRIFEFIEKLWPCVGFPNWGSVDCFTIWVTLTSFHKRPLTTSPYHQVPETETQTLNKMEPFPPPAANQKIRNGPRPLVWLPYPPRRTLRPPFHAKGTKYSTLPLLPNPTPPPLLLPNPPGSSSTSRSAKTSKPAVLNYKSAWRTGSCR
jgi:hypothetical protein